MQMPCFWSEHDAVVISDMHLAASPGSKGAGHLPPVARQSATKSHTHNALTACTPSDRMHLNCVRSSGPCRSSGPGLPSSRLCACQLHKLNAPGLQEHSFLA